MAVMAVTTAGCGESAREQATDARIAALQNEVDGLKSSAEALSRQLGNPTICDPIR